MKKIKINYFIKKHNKLGSKVKGDYVLWKEVHSERGWGIKGVFQGSKQECEEELQRIRKEGI
jgi:hypothetical protein